ncbi:hypothetical protein NUACC21_52260 [Scytonema sp. NUACC21]
MSKYIIAFIVLFITLFGFNQTALADNCGSLSDCYGVIRNAAIAGGLIAVFIGLALDFTPIIGDIKGIIEAFTGRDRVTGQRLEWWERLLGAIPILGRVGDLARVGRVIDGIGDVARRADNLGDVVRGADNLGDVARGVDNLGDVARGADNLGDVARGADNLGDVARGTDNVGKVSGAAQREVLSHVSSDVSKSFDNIDDYRRTELGRPPYTGDRAVDGVVSKFEVGGKEFFGHNSWAGRGAEADQQARQAFRDAGLLNPSGRPPVGGTANHAEGHAFLQAQQAGALNGGHGRLFIDSDMCGYCGRNGGVKNLFLGSGLDSLEVFERLPDSRIIRTVFR